LTTIADVAKKVGVTGTTISRYLNGSGYVSSETSAKIERAIAELDYKPNMIAKSLVTKKTHTIGLIIASIINPFYPDVVLGVEDESYEKGYNVILCNADGKKRENEYIDILLEKCVDGIIFSHLDVNFKQVLMLKKLKVASVLIDNEAPGLDTGNILTDDVRGGYLATEHLIRMGHKKIGLIHGSLKLNDQKIGKVYTETFQFRIWNNRLKGFLKALEQHGIILNPDFVQEGDGTADNGVEGGYRAMKQILKLKDLPTALYAQNDLMAVGAINAVHEAGLKIPGDFSIVGHDGIDLSKIIYPKLTTVQQPRYMIGRAAAKLLIEMNTLNTARKEIILHPELVLRETTRKI
jgi:DNA-binding LacI/PurR family transcriptional regulator